MLRVCNTCNIEKEIEKFTKNSGYYLRKCKLCNCIKKRTGRPKTGNFKKGQIPWNKGLKGYNPEGSHKYKKGHIPWSKGKTGFKSHIRESENRYSGKDNDWKKSVKERDGNKCTNCGSTHRLAAHHIKPWKDYPELRFDINNGLSLCNGCHIREECKGKASPLKGKKTGKPSPFKGIKTGRPAWNKGLKMKKFKGFIDANSSQQP